MSIINLEFYAENDVVVLRGVNAGLARHPLFAAYVRQINGESEPDGTIRLPTTQQELSARYQTVSGILSRLGSPLEAGAHISDALDRVEAEERRFEQFSREAYEIWHRHIDTEVFRQFVHSVENACPGRVFYRRQILSAFHLAFSQNACNFSVPGSGKTSVVYAAYAYLKGLPVEDEKRIDRLLIVGPLSSFKAWEDEYREIFLKPSLSQRISGSMPASERSDRLRGIASGSRDTEITLTSYQTLATSEEDFRVFLSRPDARTMMVLDEAHYIKRGEGYWSAAALGLSSLASSRVVLTGTPAPNGYEDLSNLFKFIYPSRNVIGFPATSLRAMTDGAMPGAIPILKKNVQPFFTRIRKSDLDLPLVREEHIPVEMDAIQQRIYRSLEQKIVPQFRLFVDDPVAPVRVRARLIRLRQACANPELLLRPIEDESIFETDGSGDFSISELEIADLVKAFDHRSLNRIRVCADLVKKTLETQEKVLIWSYFLGNLSRLKQSFESLTPFVEVLTGATPIASGEQEVEPELGTREEIIERFHVQGQKAILIANPQAVGESISLHKVCRTAIYFDRDFNAGRYIQSKDRIHRYNPSGGAEVTYYYLESPATVDLDINARLSIKEQRLANLVDSDDIPLFTDDGEPGLDDIHEVLIAYERRKTI